MGRGQKNSLASRLKLQKNESQTAATSHLEVSSDDEESVEFDVGQLLPTADLSFDSVDQESDEGESNPALFTTPSESCMYNGGLTVLDSRVPMIVLHRCDLLSILSKVKEEPDNTSYSTNEPKKAKISQQGKAQSKLSKGKKQICAGKQKEPLIPQGKGKRLNGKSPSTNRNLCAGRELMEVIEGCRCLLCGLVTRRDKIDSHIKGSHHRKPNHSLWSKEYIRQTCCVQVSTCTLCGHWCPKKRTYKLKEHVVQYHGKKTPYMFIVEKDRCEVQEPKPTCLLCDKVFPSERLLHRHHRFNHYENVKRSNITEQTAFCDHCQVPFHDKKTYARHMLHHRGKKKENIRTNKRNNGSVTSKNSSGRSATLASKGRNTTAEEINEEQVSSEAKILNEETSVSASKLNGAADKEETQNLSDDDSSESSSSSSDGEESLYEYVITDSGNSSSSSSDSDSTTDSEVQLESDVMEKRVLSESDTDEDVCIGKKLKLDSTANDDSLKTLSIECSSAKTPSQDDASVADDVVQLNLDNHHSVAEQLVSVNGNCRLPVYLLNFDSKSCEKPSEDALEILIPISTFKKARYLKFDKLNSCEIDSCLSSKKWKVIATVPKPFNTVQEGRTYYLKVSENIPRALNEEITESLSNNIAVCCQCGFLDRALIETSVIHTCLHVFIPITATSSDKCSFSIIRKSGADHSTAGRSTSPPLPHPDSVTTSNSSDDLKSTKELITAPAETGPDQNISSPTDHTPNPEEEIDEVSTTTPDCVPATSDNKNSKDKFHSNVWTNEEPNYVLALTEPYKCKFCSDKVFRLKHEHDQHTNALHFTCTLCDLQLRDRLDLNEHLIVVHEQTMCLACDMVGADETVQNHIIDIHVTESGQFKCSQCTVTSEPSSDVILQHLEQHDRAKRSRCHICAEELISDEVTFEHFLQHIETLNQYKCSKCYMFFLEQWALRKHVFDSHRSSTQLIALALNGKYDCFGVVSRPQKKCVVCWKQINRNLLHNHCQTEHKDLTISCGLCGQAFQYQHQLTFHMHKHFKQNRSRFMVCPTCLKVTSKFGSKNEVESRIIVTLCTHCSITKEEETQADSEASKAAATNDMELSTQGQSSIVLDISDL